MPFADLDDVSLFYTDDGDGDPPLLFVHGYACDSHDWSWQLAHFARRHRVIAADSRGHGRSTVPTGDYGPWRYAEDMAALLDRLTCGPVVAIGHSLGGVIVSILAVERPDLVRAVVPIDPGYLWSAERSAAFHPTYDALAGPDPTGVVEKILDRPSAGLPPALLTWHRRRISGMPPHVLRDTLQGLAREFAPAEVSRSYLSRRGCPVLALYSDPARATAEADILVSRPSRVVTFEGSGHWLHQERPHEVNAILETWLAGLEGH